MSSHPCQAVQMKITKSVPFDLSAFQILCRFTVRTRSGFRSAVELFTACEQVVLAMRPREIQIWTGNV
jgi:hypothetical protein